MERQSSDPDRAFTRVPSLEYQYGFDFCAVGVHRLRGPVAILAPSAFYLHELVKRLEHLDPALVDTRTEATHRSVLQREENLDIEPLGCWESAAKAIVWAEPESETSSTIVRSVARNLLPDGRVYIIVSGWMSRALPEWKQHDGHGNRPHLPLGLFRTLSRLRAASFKVEALHGFHGPASVFWGYLSRAQEYLNRPDLADRCHLRMRAAYAVKGWQSLLAPVGVVVVAKGPGARQ